MGATMKTETSNIVGGNMRRSRVSRCVGNSRYGSASGIVRRWVGGLLCALAAQVVAQNAVVVTPLGHSSADVLGRPWEVRIDGDYAYVAADSGGLVILDLGDPATPVRIGRVESTFQTIAVAVSGNYAYVSEYVNERPGLRVIDVSNPIAPWRVGSHDTAQTVWHVEVSGDYAYLATDSAGLQIVDISNPLNPQRVGGYVSGWEVKRLAVTGEFAYLAESRFDSVAGAYRGRMQVIDVSNPANPLRVGGYDQLSSFPSGIAVSGDHLLLLHGRTMEILDVTDPAVPTRLGGYATTGWAVRAVSVGNIAFLTEVRWDPVTQETAQYLNILDVSDPANPQRLLEWRCPFDNGDHGDLQVAGNLIYLSNPEWGIQTLRIDGLPVEARLSASIADNELVLKWPLNATNYVLESSANSAGPSWEPVTGDPQEMAGGYELTVPVDGAAHFFRLRKL
jgi:hypothetical protein